MMSRKSTVKENGFEDGVCFASIRCVCTRCTRPCFSQRGASVDFENLSKKANARMRSNVEHRDTMENMLGRPRIVSREGFNDRFCGAG